MSDWDTDEDIALPLINLVNIIHERYQRRRERLRYFNIPAANTETILNTLPYFRGGRQTYFHNETVPDQFCSNKVFSLCLNCGRTGEKNVIHELTKCYRCQSRNILIIRAIDIIRAVNYYRDNVEPVGTLMSAVYQQRKNRQREERRQRRNESIGVES